MTFSRGVAELHLAACFIGSHQGTPASVRSMAAARSAHVEGEVVFFHYDGAGDPTRPSASTSTAPPIRSGPSLRKAAATAALARRFSSFQARCCPARVIAHHVEAALVAMMLSETHWMFLAHTELEPELPSYLRSRNLLWRSTTARRLMEGVGQSVDKELLRRAPVVGAVAPALAERLEKLSGRPVPYLPVPWPPSGETVERWSPTVASKSPPRLLFAGNLDPYQGVERLVRVLVTLHRSTPANTAKPELLLLSESRADKFMDRARRAGVGAAVSVIPLRDGESRNRAYAQASVALVPRRVPGGVSIKLLDALARGIPTVVSKTAAAGLPLDGAALVVDDDPAAMASAAASILASESLREALVVRSTDYLADSHSGQAFSRSLDAAWRCSRVGWRHSRRGFFHKPRGAVAASRHP